MRLWGRCERLKRREGTGRFSTSQDTCRLSGIRHTSPTALHEGVDKYAGVISSSSDELCGVVFLRAADGRSGPDRKLSRADLVGLRRCILHWTERPTCGELRHFGEGGEELLP